MRNLSWAALVVMLVSPATAQEAPKLLTYKVHHALFGDIGKFTDEIISDGTKTRIATRADVRVDVFGITLHSMRVEWSEIWENGTLQDFSATTTRNGSAETVSGKSTGERFLIRAGTREVDAPADVQPVHPWSLQFVHAAMLMSPQSGRVFPADISDAGEESILVGRQLKRVRHYIVRTDITDHLYFDDEGTLVRAEYRDFTGEVSFTLQPAFGRIVTAR